ncbi:hypothetical protein [Streptomyces sp. CB00455]|uniref:hypothetical protein n=1 Tax=Streptomyces sp. CB00455 TaxID=1703927 RepID=UPI00116141B3|nr:hypothetical protein [Streptomyces sp. CB00455]
MKKMKASAAAAVVAVVGAAGLATSSTPAQAATCYGEGESAYICEYGITERPLPDRSLEQFVIGTDKAVWTRYTKHGHWTAWETLNGIAQSQVFIESEYVGNPLGPFHTTITVVGGDGKPWSRERTYFGGPWSPWARAIDPRP